MHVADKYGEISPRFCGPDPRRSDDDTHFAIHAHAANRRGLRNGRAAVRWLDWRGRRYCPRRRQRLGPATSLVPGTGALAGDRQSHHRPVELGLECLPYLLLPLAGNGKRVQHDLGRRQSATEAWPTGWPLLRPRDTHKLSDRNPSVNRRRMNRNSTAPPFVAGPHANDYADQRQRPRWPDNLWQ